MADIRVAAIRRAGRAEPTANYGSGYLIAERLVLTAAHVLGKTRDDADDLRVRLGEQTFRGKEIWRSSEVDGSARPVDAALVEIGDHSYRPSELTPAVGKLPPVRWGRITGRDAGVKCSAVGFPDALLDAAGRAEPEQLNATINPLSRERRGMLDVILASSPDRGPDGQSLWPGMSGAAVLSGTGQLVIGIITEVAANFGGRRLIAVPVALLERDRSFTELVERHTSYPFWTESVELERVLQPWHRSTAPRSPAALLRPEYEVVPFHGRAETLARLVDWCETRDQVRGALLHAEGGAGKTRLARELARVMHGRGWTVGVLSDNPSSPADLTQTTGNLLLIIDYAESRIERIKSLLRPLAEAPGQHAVRVLLLARSDGQWWELFTRDKAVASVFPDEPVKLGPIEYRFDSGEQMAMLTDAFGRALARIPGYTDYGGAPLAFELPWDLSSAGTYHPLSLHIEILARILARSGDGEEDALPEQVLLRHEEQYWDSLADELSAGLREVRRTREIVLVFCLLCGAHSKSQALRTIELLPGFQAETAEESRRALADWIADLYPPADPLAEYWGALAPDWLFEYLIAKKMHDEQQVLESLARSDKEGTATGLTGQQLYRALTVLTAAAAHRTDAGDELRQRLFELVATNNGVLVPIACHVSLQAIDPAPLVAALRVIIDLPSIGLEDLYAIRGFIPPMAGVLAAVGLALQRRIVAFVRSAEPGNSTRELANELNLLGIYLARNEHAQEAVAASAESVAAYRRLAVISGNDAYEYAIALSNHASNLQRTADWEESHQVACEVVDLVERSESPPSATRTALAGALNCICLYRAQRGDLAGARDALSRAVELQREEVAGDAEPFLFATEHLGHLLANMVDVHDSSDSQDEKISLLGECVEIFRDLYLAQPGRYADVFQKRAVQLAGMLSEKERHAEAASLYGQAAEALMRLWDDGNSNGQLRLGLVLVHQAEQLSQAASHTASVVYLLERSCEVLQDLFQRDPALSAQHYLQILKYFIQGAQLVAEKFDIRPRMAEVANALDYIVAEWERDGQVPHDSAVVPNLAMFLTWTIRAGEWTATVPLCERVGRLLGDAQDDGDAINRRVLLGVLLMIRAKAEARLRDEHAAAATAVESADILAGCNSPDSNWPAYVAAEGLADVARYLAGAGACATSLRLNSIGIELSRRFLEQRRYTWAPILADHLINSGALSAKLQGHAKAAECLADGIELIRWLAHQEPDAQREPYVAFDIQQVQSQQAQSQQGFADNLDWALELYAQVLAALGRLSDEDAVLAELVDLRRTRHAADPVPEREVKFVETVLGYAHFLLETQQHSKAAEVARASLSFAREQSANRLGSPSINGSLLWQSARILLQAGCADEALEAVSNSIAVFRAMDPASRPNYDFAVALCDKSMILGRLGRNEEALPIGAEGVQLLEDMAGSGSPDHQRTFAAAVHNHIVSLYQVGQEEQALQLYSRHRSLLGDWMPPK
jgi:hypothetical protein